MSIRIPWNIKKDVYQRVHAALFLDNETECDQRLQKLQTVSETKINPYDPATIFSVHEDQS